MRRGCRMGGDSARWWQGWLVRGMRRHGWFMVRCPSCQRWIEFTAREHEHVARLVHRIGCDPH